jgi:HAD superfamily hydrolase (TIGR01509 family)
MRIKALIFDVDGTMADTEEAHRVAFNLAFQRHRLGWTWQPTEYRDLLKITGGKERLAHYIGTLALARPERSRLFGMVTAIHAEKTRFYSAFVADGAVPLRDGVARLLEEALAAGCKLGIASTTSGSNIEALLNSTLGSRGLEIFSVIACGDQVRAKKPAPDIYHLALHRLGISAANAAAIEDSPNGLEAAAAAQIWTVVTPSFWTHEGDFSRADLLLPRLGDPHYPVAGEPGNKLAKCAWLSFDELVEKASERSIHGAKHAH